MQCLPTRPPSHFGLLLTLGPMSVHSSSSWSGERQHTASSHAWPMVRVASTCIQPSPAPEQAKEYSTSGMRLQVNIPADFICSIILIIMLGPAIIGRDMSTGTAGIHVPVPYLTMGDRSRHRICQRTTSHHSLLIYGSLESHRLFCCRCCRFVNCAYVFVLAYIWRYRDSHFSSSFTEISKSGFTFWKTNDCIDVS